MMRALLLISVLATHYREIAELGFRFGQAATGLGAVLAGALLVRRWTLRRHL